MCVWGVGGWVGWVGGGWGGGAVHMYRGGYAACRGVGMCVCVEGAVQHVEGGVCVCGVCVGGGAACREGGGYVCVWGVQCSMNGGMGHQLGVCVCAVDGGQ